MEIYLIIVVVLFLLAISDLIVGVSNDAVNFLNSAIGSRVAPRHIIMIIASLGILIGTTFSSGLMEVARKGIFHPDKFMLEEIMVVFLAVMLTDVILLDLFNTFALPTSTTVSIVFELLGAAVAVSLIKVSQEGDGLSALVEYINTSQALAIISGILLSVAIAFTAGAIIQFFTRLIFTFDYNDRIRRYGGIWGGIALTSITYFILVKGAKGSSFLTEGTQEWIKLNTDLIILFSVVFWGLLIQCLIWFTKVNILKPIVLVGTFALALAFAANDLVNFIGVPLAGLSSYQIASGNADPLTMTMEALRQPVKSNTILLLLAGIIMVVTLWFSSKAKSVTKTEVNLGRQSEGFERFDSTLVSRAIVRMNLYLFEGFRRVLPQSALNFISRRIDNERVKHIKGANVPAFDLIRASVNLMVASIVISFATSLKLPLSTTYVTFMVAMGTSLSDKAWGRESAVYRVTGVLTVIGGWFFTAFMAFTVAGVFATIIFFGGMWAIAILLIVAGIFIYRSHVHHKTKVKEEEELEKAQLDEDATGSEFLLTSMVNAGIYLEKASETVTSAYKGLFTEDRGKLRDTVHEAKVVKKFSTSLISDAFRAFKRLDEQQVKKGHRYGKIVTAVQEIAANVKSLSKRCYDHIDNTHLKPSEAEIQELTVLNEVFVKKMTIASKILKEKNFERIEEFKAIFDDFLIKSQEFDENEVRRLKDGSTSPRNGLLNMAIVGETENISHHVSDLLKVSKKNYEKLQETGNI